MEFPIPNRGYSRPAMHSTRLTGKQITMGYASHPPNIDAVLFFMEKIYPLVRNRLPDARFYIIGDNAPPEIVALANDDIIVTGLQRDLRPFFKSVKLSVAPLRWVPG